MKPKILWYVRQTLSGHGSRVDPILRLHYAMQKWHFCALPHFLWGEEWVRDEKSCLENSEIKNFRDLRYQQVKRMRTSSDIVPLLRRPVIYIPACKHNVQEREINELTRFIVYILVCVLAPPNCPKILVMSSWVLRSPTQLSRVELEHTAKYWLCTCVTVSALHPLLKRFKCMQRIYIMNSL